MLDEQLLTEVALWSWVVFVPMGDATELQVRSVRGGS